MNRTHLPAFGLALLAALLFGASAPLSKLLLGQIDPILMAAFLYLGSGLGLLIVKITQLSGKIISDKEAAVKKADLPWLAGSILAGGIAAPILLMFSLRVTPAATASLLLNFEGVATTLIAALAFKEAVSRRAWWAIGMITLASILLSVNLNSEWGFSLGALGILAACALWGVDNNFTRNISAKDPLTIVMFKGFGAGTFSLFLAWFTGSPLPGWGTILAALLLGSLSYGLSITLFIHAMRGLGAARTSALFGTAPLAGIGLSFLIFRDAPGWMFWLAIPFILAGTLFLVSEEHGHEHIHEPASHEHAHNHTDGHHDHLHADGIFNARTHSHLHEHRAEEHKHDHLPDTHHRHGHESLKGPDA